VVKEKAHISKETMNTNEKNPFLFQLLNHPVSVRTVLEENEPKASSDRNLDTAQYSPQHFIALTAKQTERVKKPRSRTETRN
jgi:hypothetical protein